MVVGGGAEGPVDCSSARHGGGWEEALELAGAAGG